MRFNFGEPTSTLTATDQLRWTDTFAGVTFDCGDCGSSDTVETDTLNPSGMGYLVRCESGHVTVGRPPARFLASV